MLIYIANQIISVVPYPYKVVFLIFFDFKNAFYTVIK